MAMPVKIKRIILLSVFAVIICVAFVKTAIISSAFIDDIILNYVIGGCEKYSYEEASLSFDQEKKICEIINNVIAEYSSDPLRADGYACLAAKPDDIIFPKESSITPIPINGNAYKNYRILKNRRLEYYLVSVLCFIDQRNQFTGVFMQLEIKQDIDNPALFHVESIRFLENEKDLLYASFADVLKKRHSF